MSMSFDKKGVGEDVFDEDGMFGVAFKARELSRIVAQGGSSSAARTSMRGGGGGGILAVVRAVQPGQQYKGH